MDDSFAFRTDVPVRRQFDPTMVRLAVFLMLLVLGVGLFANWVVASERQSFSRTSPRQVPTGSEVAQPGTVAAPSTTAAGESAGIALRAARATFSEHRSFLDAGPAQLSIMEPAYTFVDGPSTTPEVVSVAATTDTWAAAVQVPGGVCLWVRATGAGDVTHGVGSDCTGSAALAPPSPR